MTNTPARERKRAWALLRCVVGFSPCSNTVRILGSPWYGFSVMPPYGSSVVVNRRVYRRVYGLPVVPLPQRIARPRLLTLTKATA